MKVSNDIQKAFIMFAAIVAFVMTMLSIEILEPAKNSMSLIANWPTILVSASIIWMSTLAYKRL